MTRPHRLVGAFVLPLQEGETVPVTASDHSGPAANAGQNDNEGVCAGQSDAQGRLTRLAELITSSPHNLVAASERPHVLERHVFEGDALAASLQPAGRWMDLGTGGGLPGLVLAVRFPEVQWTLMDATAKKVAAVASFAAALGLDNVVTVHSPAEILAHDPAHRGVYDGVVSRAVAPLRTLAELGRGFLKPGGHLVAVKGPRWEDEVAAAAGALRRLHMRVIHSEVLAAAVRPTWVVTMAADGPPPAGFPRRPGLPKHEPLQ